MRILNLSYRYRKYSWNKSIKGALSACLVGTLVSPMALAQENLYPNVDRLLRGGYSPEAIVKHEISNGNTIFSIVDAAVRSDPDREPEFRLLGLDLLGGLPPSACGGSRYVQTRQWKPIRSRELSTATVADVANLFFESDYQITQLDARDSHGSYSVTELLELAQKGGYWYKVMPVRNHPAPNAVFVALYKEGQEIIVDTNLGMLEEVAASGAETVPVVFHYHFDQTVPVSRFQGDEAGIEIIDAYRRDLVEVSQSPNWKSGEYHTLINIGDLEEQFSIPNKSDV